MDLFYALAADHRLLKFQLPGDLTLGYLFPEWSLPGVLRRELVPGGMVRVVNPEKALQLCACRGSGSVILELHDELLPQNSGRFRLDFAEGTPNRVTRTGEDPDLRLEIGAFSALLAGASDFQEAAAWMEGIEVLRDNPALSQVFYRKPLLVTEEF